MKRLLPIVIASALALVILGASAAGAGNNKVEICHVNGATGAAPFPPGNPVVTITYGRVISVSVNAYAAHLAHGDGTVQFTHDANPNVWTYGTAFGVAANSNCAFNVPID